MRLPFRFLFCPVLALALAASAGATSTVRLPPGLCSGAGTDRIFGDGFEAAAIPHDPSNGSGGSFPGDVTRTIAVAGFGNRSYYLHLPPDYTPARSWPLLLALRGSTSPAATATAAQQVRSDWSAWSDSGGFIVLAPVGTSTQGGWGASGDGAELSAALDDAFARYNVERSRIYLWGFSAGAHFAHALALNNTDFFAAYGVSAGSLEQYACTDDGSFPPTCATLLSAAQLKIPVDIHLGTSDPLASPPYTAAGDPARFQGQGWVSGQTLFYTSFAGGHTYTTAHLGQIWGHLCGFALGP